MRRGDVVRSGEAGEPGTVLDLRTERVWWGGRSHPVGVALVEFAAGRRAWVPTGTLEVVRESEQAPA